MKYRGWLRRSRRLPARGRRPALAKIAGLAAGAMLALQVLTIATLQIISAVRKKLDQQQPPSPHEPYPAVSVGVNVARVFDYGQQLYDDMLAAIDAARESIYLETFILKGDATGRAFKEALIRKAEQGVAVYIMYDHFANLVVPPAFKRFPEPVHAIAYRAMTRPWHPLDPRHYALEHRKVLVTDGQTAFIGGYNIGDPYATTWRDTHLRLDGPAAADLAQMFVRFWNSHAAPADHIEHHVRRRFEPLINVQGNDAAQLTFPIRDMYIAAIDTAEDRIWLTSAYFVPDQSLIRALLAARRRGVEVRILVPWTSNHVAADWLARGYFSDLLHEGVRIFGYRSMLHAKTCVIDGQWCTIGTANLDRLSAVGNYEVNVELYSPELAAQMEAMFEHDLKHAFEIQKEEWQRRPWYAKLSELILEPLRGLM